jgi:hypothetical protein
MEGGRSPEDVADRPADVDDTTDRVGARERLEREGEVAREVGDDAHDEEEPADAHAARREGDADSHREEDEIHERVRQGNDLAEVEVAIGERPAEEGNPGNDTDRSGDDEGIENPGNVAAALPTGDKTGQAEREDAISHEVDGVGDRWERRRATAELLKDGVRQVAEREQGDPAADLDPAAGIRRPVKDSADEHAAGPCESEQWEEPAMVRVREGCIQSGGRETEREVDDPGDSAGAPWSSDPGGAFDRRRVTRHCGTPQESMSGRS